MTTNLVVGATGVLGFEVCRSLVQHGKPVRALVRASAEGWKVDRLRAIGAELVEGDVQDAASIERAVAGTDGVITTLSTTYSRRATDNTHASDLEGQQRLIDLARAAGTRHLVYTSMTQHAPADMEFVQIRRTVEAHAASSGLEWTVIRPSSFMDTYLSPIVGFEFVKGHVNVFGAGEGRINWIAARDVADYAVESLDNPAGRNAILEIGGPDFLSPMEVIAIAEELVGHPIAVTHVPEEALRAQVANATSEYDVVFPSFALKMVIPGEGVKTDMSALHAAYPGITPTTVRAYLSQFVGQG
jgi:uncharacterized protein YbjT (DUF2867 family)